MSGSEDELFEKADAGDSGYWIKKCKHKEKEHASWLNQTMSKED